MLTVTNADSVPILIISSSRSTLVSPATTATAAPQMIWSRTGVARMVLVLDSERGSRPSRLMASTTRESPISSTMITVVRPTREPNAMILAASLLPTASKAVVRVGFSASASWV